MSGDREKATTSGAAVLRRMAMLYAPPALLVAAATLVVGDGRQMQIGGRPHTLQLSQLSQDPTAVAQLPPFVGAVSTLAVVLWTVGAAVALFGGAVAGGRAGSFLLHVGALTLVLALDDAYQLHESVVPGLLNIPEEASLAGYALVLAAAVARFPHRFLRRKHVATLGPAAVFFAVAMSIDLANPGLPHTAWLEDASKLLGIVGWMGYILSSASDILRSSGLTTAEPRPR